MKKVFGFALFALFSVLYFQSKSQNVGIGTETPLQFMHLSNDTNNVILFETRDVPGALSSSGPLNPSSFINDPETGTSIWQNMSNAVSSDDQYAFQPLHWEGDPPSLMKATGWGFDIPEGACILGILIGIEKHGSACYDGQLNLLKNNSVVGDNKAQSSPWPDSDTYIDYGGSDELWGAAWTTEEINNTGFGLAFKAETVTQGQAYIDHLRITVYYKPLINTYWSLGTDFSENAKFKLSASSLLDNNNAICIESNGLIGLGTTTPSSRLDVNGNVTANEYYGDGSNLSGLVRTLDDAYNKSGNIITLNGLGGNIRFCRDTDDSNELLFLEQSSGNIGIGNTAPEEKLDVDGILQAYRTKFTNPSGGDAGSIYASTSGYLQLTPQNGYHILLPEDIEMKVMADGGSGNQIMVVKESNESIGIGTSTPTAKLDVLGTTKLSYASTTDPTLHIVNDGPYSDYVALKVSCQGHPVFQLSSDTCLGLGTSNPKAALHIIKKDHNYSDTSWQIRLAHMVPGTVTAGTKTGILLYGFNNNEEDCPQVGLSGDFSDSFDGTEDSYLGIYLNDDGNFGEKARITGKGAFAIGTTTPNANLHIRSNGDYGHMLNLQHNIPGNDVDISFAEGSTYYSLGIDGSQNAFKISANTSLGTNDRLVVDASGNIGIGLTNPQQKLSVNGDMKLSGALYDLNSSSGTSGFVLKSSGDAIEWTDPAELADNDWSISGDNIYKTSGTVAIGTEQADNSDFHVYKSYDPASLQDSSSLMKSFLKLKGTYPSTATSEIRFGHQYIVDDSATHNGSGEQILVGNYSEINVHGTVEKAFASLHRAYRDKAPSKTNYTFASNPGASGFHTSGELTYIYGLGANMATNNSGEGTIRRGGGIWARTEVNKGHSDTLNVVDVLGEATDWGSVQTVDHFSGVFVGMNLLHGTFTNIYGIHIPSIGKTSPASVTGSVYALKIDAPTAANDASQNFAIYCDGGKNYFGGNIGIGETNPTKSLVINGDMSLSGALYDFNSSSGSSGYILKSTGNAIQWTDPAELADNDWSISGDNIYKTSGTVAIGTEQADNSDFHVYKSYNPASLQDSSSLMKSLLKLKGTYPSTATSEIRFGHQYIVDDSATHNGTGEQILAGHYNEINVHGTVEKAYASLHRAYRDKAPSKTNYTFASNPGASGFHSSGELTYIYGLGANMATNNSGDGTIRRGGGIWARTEVNTGHSDTLNVIDVLGEATDWGSVQTVDHFSGVFVGMNLLHGTFTNIYGIHIPAIEKTSPASVTGSVYALKIDAPTAANTASENYALFVDGGMNYFGGNVGIGTTDAIEHAQLTIAKNDGWGGELALHRPKAIVSGDILGYLWFTGKMSSVDNYGAWIKATATDTWSYPSFTYCPTDLSFGTQNGLGDDTRMVIKSQGNVGIGTTQPHNKLEVDGTIRANDGFNINGTDGSGTDFTIVTDVRLNGDQLEKKTRNIQLTGGIITNVGSESGWTSAGTVP